MKNSNKNNKSNKQNKVQSNNNSKSKLDKFIQSKIWLAISAFSIVFGIYGSYITIHDHFRNTKQALEYIDTAKKYFSEQKMDKTIEYAQKAYTIDSKIPNLTYYYTLALLKRNNVGDKDTANNIFIENSDYLSDNEKAIYASLESNSGNYNKAYNILKTINNPVFIKTEVFPRYIVGLCESIFHTVDYKTGVSVLLKNNKYIDRKLNTLGILPNDSVLKVFSDIPIDLTEDDMLNMETYPIKFCKVYISNALFENILKKNDEIKADTALKIGGDGFEVFGYYDRAAGKLFLKNFCLFISKYQQFSDEHIKNIKYIFFRTINSLENAESSNAPDAIEYKNLLLKLKLLYNIFSDSYNLNWEKYDINLPNDISVPFNITLNENVKLSNMSIEKNVFNDTIYLDYKLTNSSQYSVNTSLNFRKGLYSKNNVFKFCLAKTDIFNNTSKIPFTPQLIY